MIFETNFLTNMLIWVVPKTTSETEERQMLRDGQSIEVSHPFAYIISNSLYLQALYTFFFLFHFLKLLILQIVVVSLLAML